MSKDLASDVTKCMKIHYETNREIHEKLTRDGHGLGYRIRKVPLRTFCRKEWCPCDWHTLLRAKFGCFRSEALYNSDKLLCSNLGNVEIRFAKNITLGYKCENPI